MYKVQHVASVKVSDVPAAQYPKSEVLVSHPKAKRKRFLFKVWPFDSKLWGLQTETVGLKG